MNLIVAVSKNWGIGKDNQLLFSIPQDMKFFRFMTKDKTVVMGRKTLESFPGGKPLKNRVNLVLTGRRDYEAPGAIVCSSVEDVLSQLENYASEEVFIIGGESVYKTFLPYCDCAYITKVDAYADADTFMENLDRLPQWKLTEQSEPQEENGYSFTFCKYEKI